MRKGKVLELDFSELPLPVRIVGRDGKEKYYLMQSSGKKLGACLCGLDESIAKCLTDR